MHILSLESFRRESISKIAKKKVDELCDQIKAVPGVNAYCVVLDLDETGPYAFVEEADMELIYRHLVITAYSVAETLKTDYGVRELVGCREVQRAAIDLQQSCNIPVE
ncbi:hypothetical protein KOR42_23340 [Thalassoglobus neptunius]|uniref:Uncharacterized protein n=1 Tax=Thalassoglobus neptunius TaxID=1938619 RepID=A0A5C5X744_9PLAN|nr:hypothetical protein [Thalassoglobus neptunius]TWT58947.1 hypothetical protein KOR42_23340 [Thalassoglobus neptunius]